MVYMSGSKAARNAASIVNRQNVCGGNKKAGIAPRVGWYLTSNVNLVGAPQTLPRFCQGLSSNALGEASRLLDNAAVQGL